MGLRRATALIATAATLGLSLIGAAPASATTASPASATLDCSTFSSSIGQTFTGPVGSTFTVTNTANLARCPVISLSGATVTGLSQGAGSDELAAGATATFTITGDGGFSLSGGGYAHFTIALGEGSTSGSTVNLSSVYPTGYINPNGGTCFVTLKHTARPGTIASFTAPIAMDCLRPDYQLVGWAREPDATSSDFAPGATVPIGSSSFTLYALWSPLGVEVTYDANVAPGTPCLRDDVDQTTAESRLSGPFVVYPTSAAATSAPCAPDGYSLMGWARTGVGPVALLPGQPFDTVQRSVVDKVRVVAPEDSSTSDVCCPTRSRSAGTPRLIAPIDTQDCTRSATRGTTRVIDIGSEDQGDSGACRQTSSFASGTSTTLYAVWGRAITSDCPALRGKPLWTFECTDFGDVPVGAKATLSVAITNQSQKTHSLQLKDWPSAMAVNGSLTVASSTCATLPAKGRCALRLTWAPSQVGGLGSVPLIMCETGNPNQCYQPSAAQQLRGTATPAANLVTYDVELTAPKQPLLTGTSTTVSVSAFRNGVAAGNAEIGLELEGGIVLADGTKAGTVTTNASGIATFAVTGTFAATSAVHAAFGNASASLPVTVADLLVEFDKTSIKAGEEAKATITAAPNTRIKYTTFGKLAGLNPGRSCGQAYSSRFWGMVSGLMRMAEPVTTDSEGHVTISTCGLLAPNPRGQSMHSFASADATGPGSISAVIVNEERYCGPVGCPWGDVDSAAAASASLDVRTQVNLSVQNGLIPVVSSRPNPDLNSTYPTSQGVTVTLNSPAVSGGRFNAQVTSGERPTLWIANRYEVKTSATPGVFPYSADGFTAPDPKRVYLTSGQQLRLYYVTGQTSPVTPTITMDVIVPDVASVLGKSHSYVVFPDAIKMISGPDPVAGTPTRLSVICDSNMGIDCSVTND